ncbi:MAG: hypothetical protein IJ729_06300, partial [Alloprevotella sp.]|nr:hypothetical protein [Alloprevotella sp.]
MQRKVTFSALLLSLLAGLMAVSASAQQPAEFDLNYLYELRDISNDPGGIPYVTLPNGELFRSGGEADAGEEYRLWRLEQLSGGWRIINPATDVALRVSSEGLLETG